MTRRIGPLGVMIAAAIVLSTATWGCSLRRNKGPSPEQLSMEAALNKAEEAANEAKDAANRAQEAATRAEAAATKAAGGSTESSAPSGPSGASTTPAATSGSPATTGYDSGHAPVPTSIKGGSKAVIVPDMGNDLAVSPLRGGKKGSSDDN